MKLQIAESVQTYFSLSNGLDTAHIADCFTQDAVVVDEGNTHRGHDAIRSWLQQARNAFEYSVEPISVVEEGNRIQVIAEVTGNFPGSPVKLTHAFLMAGDRIQSLEIH